MKKAYIRLIFLGIVLVLVTTSILTYRSLVGYTEEVGRIRKSSDIQRSLELILSTVKDAETAQRGYQLSRDSAFLEPLQEALDTIPYHMRMLDSLIAGDRIQKINIDTLNYLVETQLKLVSEIFARQDTRIMDAREKRLLNSENENMVKVRKIIYQMTKYEDHLLEAKPTRERMFRFLTPIVLLAFTLLAIGSTVFLFTRGLEALDEREAAELKQNEAMKELNENERRYRSLFERSIDPIFLTNNQLQIVAANESFLTFFQYSLPELKMMPLRKLFMNEDDFEAFGMTLQLADQIRDFEVVMLSTKGELKSCLINFTFIQNRTSEFSFQGIIHDQTLRKKSEKDMLIAERLSMTGKIARSVAHEIRNPLTNLNLALEELKDEIPAGKNHVGSYFDIIQRNVGRIEQLISEMLNSSKPRELNVALTNLNRLMDETIQLANDRIQLNQISLERDYEMALPLILLDKDQMKMALLNIVINAVEAVEEGKGQIFVSTERSGLNITLTIRDNGKGMNDEDIEKLFDPFFTSKQGGMGLGLTTTKNILNSHNITVEVTSSPGQGTTFLLAFVLPG